MAFSFYMTSSYRFLLVFPIATFICRFLIDFHKIADIVLLVGVILVSTIISWISVKILNTYVFSFMFKETNFLDFICSLKNKGDYHILHICFLIFSFILMFSCFDFLGKTVPLFGSR